MKHITTYLVVLFTALGLNFLPIMASNAEAESLVLKPVMIIRFNEPRVYFQKQLATVIRHATQVKYDVAFDVIQFVPATSENGEFDANIKSVLAGIAANGVPENRVQASIQTSPDVTTDEVYIYVR